MARRSELQHPRSTSAETGSGVCGSREVDHDHVQDGRDGDPQSVECSLRPDSLDEGTGRGACPSSDRHRRRSRPSAAREVSDGRQSHQALGFPVGRSSLAVSRRAQRGSAPRAARPEGRGHRGGASGGCDLMRNVLILGASYGSLFGTKLLMAGHRVSLVCTKPTANLINREGTVVRMPIKGREALLDIASKKLSGKLTAVIPDDADPDAFDLVVLGMQEAQYGSDGVRQLMARVARPRKPCLAIMNMPPLPYLKRIPGLSTEALEACYADPGVWTDFDPALMTLASPDPQAFRPPDQPKNVLQVGLPTNFKAAPFESADATALLRAFEADIEAARFDPGDGAIEIPVKLKVHDSIFVPLAKWPMLMAGNYRCIRRDDMIPIKEAVHAN